MSMACLHRAFSPMCPVRLELCFGNISEETWKGLRVFEEGAQLPDEPIVFVYAGTHNVYLEVCSYKSSSQLRDW